MVTPATNRSKIRQSHYNRKFRVINGPIRQLCNIEVPQKIEARVQPLGIGFAEMPLL